MLHVSGDTLNTSVRYMRIHTRRCMSGWTEKLTFLFDIYWLLQNHTSVDMAVKHHNNTRSQCALFLTSGYEALINDAIAPRTVWLS